MFVSLWEADTNGMLPLILTFNPNDLKNNLTVYTTWKNTE